MIYITQQKDLRKMNRIKKQKDLRKVKAGKKGGKIGGKKGKKVTIEDYKGKVLHFDTIKEAAGKFDLSVLTMRKYIKKGEFERVIKHKKRLYRIVNN